MDEDYKKLLFEKQVCTEKDIEFLLEVYRQSCLHVRAFMDLRFKHFTTYIAIMVLFGAVLKEIEQPKYAFVIAIVEIINSLLFNLLDSRTAEYLAANNRNCMIIEAKFKRLFPLVLETGAPSDIPKPRIFKSSVITKLIFYLFIMMWILVALYYLVELLPNIPQSIKSIFLPNA